MDKKSKGLVVGAGLGILAGVIAGVLLAPKSGKETRADLSKYAAEMKEKIAKELTKAGKVSKEAYKEIVDKIVKVYELEKKITAEDAKDIAKKLDQNFEEVKRELKK
jgi:gas vesicle protein